MNTKKRKRSAAQDLLTNISGKKLTLNNLLLAIREGEEMSQVAFAKLLGVSKQYLCDLEHNRRIVSPGAAKEYANKLGYSPQQFVRLCLQDMMEREGISFIIEVKAA